jgi:F-type H+-transporting ATPase subunit a
MEEVHELFKIEMLGIELGITSSLIIQWIVIILLAILSIILTRNLRKVPDKKQSILEIMVSSVTNLVRENMGEHYKTFVPLIGTFMIYILILNLIPLIGFKAPTEDLSVTLGLGVITFLVIQSYTIKKIGIIHYFTGFAKPIPMLLPINIIERIMLPVSLSLRLFGNITAGAVIMKLLYDALSSLNLFAQLAIPVPLHFYFDAFDGVIQMIIFVMLTMINIKVISEH